MLLPLSFLLIACFSQDGGVHSYDSYVSSDWSALGSYYSAVDMTAEYIETTEGHPDCPCMTAGEVQAADFDWENSTYIGCSLETDCPYPSCGSYKCLVDTANCDMSQKKVEDTVLSYSYATCGSDDPSTRIEVLKDATLKVMLVPEQPNSFLGLMSGQCIGDIGNFPQGCTGWTYTVLDKLSKIAEFDVEYVQVLPDGFWNGVRDYCLLTEGATWGTAEHSIKRSHLCTLQIWTVCAYAAALGYVDFCPNHAVQSNERLSYTTGLIYFEEWYSLYTKIQVKDEGPSTWFKIFTVWTGGLWICVLCWVFAMGFMIRWLSGFYSNATVDQEMVLRELPEIFWFGWGLFLDLIYPQHLPTIPAKLSLLSFEFVQVIFLASITASLTFLLLAEDAGGIMNLQEVIANPGYLCFDQDVIVVDFLASYPTFPESKTKVYFEFNGVSDEGNDCIALYSRQQSMEIHKSKGAFCEWTHRQRLNSGASFGATSPRAHEGLMAAYTIYKNSGEYTADLDTWLRSSIKASTCDISENADDVTSLSIAPFGGLFLVTAGIAIFSIAYTVVMGFPEGLKNHQMHSFISFADPRMCYTFEASKRTTLEESHRNRNDQKTATAPT